MTRRGICIVFLAALLSACGFHVRGASNFAFKRLFVTSANPQMAADFKRYVRYGSHTVIVDDAKDADARLEILSVSQNRTAVSVNAHGQAREYELSSVTAYRLVDPNGKEIIPRTEIRLVRNLPYSDAEAQARDTEAVLLYRDMIRDTVNQLIRRLEAVKTLDGVS